MTFDLTENKTVFKNVVALGVNGYITNICDKEELQYLIKRIINGKKVYEGGLVESIMTNDNDYSINKLTEREKEVLYSIVQGYGNKEIANLLCITEYTVKKHVSSILNKLDLKNRKELIINVGSQLNKEIS